MLRALVVDDEQITADLIGRYLEATGSVEVERIIYNPLEVIKEVELTNPDVVFLDIEMPEISGLELAEKITAMVNQPEVVFITAYSSYALEAFKVNALDYVMKPIDPHELERVIQKINNRRPQVTTNHTLSIKALGGFTAVVVGDQREHIKWSTAKCEELFAYMIFKGERVVVSKWNLIDVLWPEKDTQKSEINLRSTISRLNKTLRDYGVNSRIISHNNRYKLEIENWEVDAFQLEKRSEEWLKDGPKALPSLQTLHKLYPGDLFAEQYYAWAEWLQSYYLRIFIRLGKEIVHTRIARHEDMDITYMMLAYIVELDPYNEDLREMAIEILYKIKGQKAIKEYYQNFEQRLMSQVGVHPRHSFKGLYQRLTNLENG